MAGVRSGNGGAHGRIFLPGGLPNTSGTGTGRGVRVRGGLSGSSIVGTGRGVRTRGGFSGSSIVGTGRGVRIRGGSNSSSSVGARYITTCGRYTWDRGGLTGSKSHLSRTDPISDMPGVLREQPTRAITDHYSGHYNDDTDHEDANHEDVDLEDVNLEDDDYVDADNEDADHPSSQHDSYVGASRDTSRARMIRRSGKGFECEHGDVHKSITRILTEHFDGPWMTFKQVPRDVVDRMYDCFKTRWRWEPTTEQEIREGFINVLKWRYRDVMRQFRVKATENAVDAGKKINPKNYKQFGVICKFPPDSIPDNVWRELCSRWNTTSWLKKSQSGSDNRNSKPSRHTGGSMGYAEHRVRWKRRMNEEANFKQLFLETHLTKACKENLYAGKIDIYNLDDLVFCDDKSEKAYGDYLKAMHDVYGDNFRDYPDDHEVWARVQSQGRTSRVYGIGSADLQYAVTGMSSSFSGSTPSHAEYQKSQEEVRVMRTQMVGIEARFEEERKAREELQQQFQDFVKTWRPPSH